MQPYGELTLPVGSDPSPRRAHLWLVTGATPAVVGGPRCRCGHGRQVHEHYRGGTDCATCPCARFSRSVTGRLGLRRR